MTRPARRGEPPAAWGVTIARGCVHSGWSGGEGLGIGHVEPGGPDQPLLQRRHQIVAEHDAPARHVDEDGVALHLAEEVAREEMVGGLGEGQPDDHHVRLAEQPGHLIRLPDGLHAGLGRHVLDVHGEHAHAEPQRAAGHRPPGAAEAHDAHRPPEELPLGAADLLAQAVVRLPEGGVDAPGEGEEQREGMLGEVNADLALLAGQDDVALHQLWREDGVDARADRMVVAEPAVQGEDVGGHAPEQDLGVDDLLSLGGGIAGLDEGRRRTRGLEDAGALLVAEGRYDQVGRVDDLHGALSVAAEDRRWNGRPSPGGCRSSTGSGAFAIVAMVVNHTGRWWIDGSFGWPRYHLIYITTTVAAPIFLFLVGFCQAIAHYNATVLRGQSAASVAPRYLRRGVQVILAGYLLNLVVFPKDPLWQLGVLQTIGFSILALIPALAIIQHAWGRALIVAISVALYVGLRPVLRAPRSVARRAPSGGPGGLRGLSAVAVDDPGARLGGPRLVVLRGEPGGGGRARPVLPGDGRRRGAVPARLRGLRRLDAHARALRLHARLHRQPPLDAAGRDALLGRAPCCSARRLLPGT